MTETPAPIDAIDSWHAHVYYDPATKPQAATLRAWVEERYPVRMGRWHDVPVGPHAQAMYQIAFEVAALPEIAPFLALNRHGLSILLHPETGHARADHTSHALWLGPPLPINVSVLPE